MARKSVRPAEDVHERVRAHDREDGTSSETVARPLREAVLVIMPFDFLGEGLRDTIDPELETSR